MKTALCDKLGIDLPIIQAPMGGAVGPALAASVSNAGVWECSCSGAPMLRLSAIQSMRRGH